MLGERLRHHIEQLIANYSARLRSDPLTPMAKTLPAPLVEDHAMSFLSDVFQSLVVLEKAEELEGHEESDMLSDGSQIQRLVAELTGGSDIEWAGMSAHCTGSTRSSTRKSSR